MRLTDEQTSRLALSVADRSNHAQIFIDNTGRRWRRIRRVALVIGVLTTVLTLVMVGTLVFVPPIPPELPLGSASSKPVARNTNGRPGAFTKVDRLRTAYRRKLATLAKQYGSAVSRQPELVPVLNVGRGARPTRTEAIVAGFYVNWEDKSLASLRRNYEKLDWVIGEWAFVPTGADSLQLRIDKKVVDLLSNNPPETRPSLFIMLSNYVVAGNDSASGRFDAKAVQHFLANPVARANAIRQLKSAVQQYGLAGTTLDMEGFSTAQQAPVLAFARELHDAMHGMGKLA